MKQTTTSLLTLLFAMSAATQAWTISRPALVRPQSMIRETRLCAAINGGDIKDDVQDIAYEATDGVKDAAGDAADELSDSATDVADDISNAADDVADAAEDAKENIDPDRAFEDKTVLGKVKDKAVDVKDFVKDKAVDTKDAVKDKAVTAKDYVKDKAASVKEAVVGSED